MEANTNCLPHYRRGGKCKVSRSRDATGDWCFRYASEEEDNKDRCNTNETQLRLQCISRKIPNKYILNEYILLGSWCCLLISSCSYLPKKFCVTVCTACGIFKSMQCCGSLTIYAPWLYNGKNAATITFPNLEQVKLLLSGAYVSLSLLVYM